MFWFKKKEKKVELKIVAVPKTKKIDKTVKQKEKNKIIYQHVPFAERCRRFSSGERFQRFK